MRYFIVAFLLVSTLLSNIFLLHFVDMHSLEQQAYIKSMTNIGDSERHKGYKQTKELKEYYKTYTVYTFLSTLTIAILLLNCESRRRKLEQREESDSR